VSVEASELSIAEVGRAVKRTFPDGDESEALEGVVLHKVTADVLRRAARLQPPTLRALDAIHLATALSLGTDDTSLVTYDARLAEVARTHGVRVVQPGR
jgi:predicted nucleic acid-binding protein